MPAHLYFDATGGGHGTTGLFRFMGGLEGEGGPGPRTALLVEGRQGALTSMT